MWSKTLPVPRPEHFSDQDGKRFVVQIGWIVTLREAFCKSYLARRRLSFEKELQYYKDELKARIFAFILQWKNNFDEESAIISNGNIFPEISSFSDLSTLASKVCSEEYPDTLIVNNELINKNTISGSITLAKKHVISGILEGKSPQNYYGVDYLSPDYIAIRSVLVKN